MFYGILKDQPANNPSKELIAIFATPLTIFSEPQGIVAESINFKRYVMEQTAQRWAIEADLNRYNTPPELTGHRLVHGDNSTIYVQFPQPYSQNPLMEPPVVRLTVAANRRVSELNVSGTVTPYLYINIGTTPGKVYFVTSVAPGKCFIYPTLREAMPINTQIFQGPDVIMKANYDVSFIRGMKYENGILATPGQTRLVEEV